MSLLSRIASFFTGGASAVPQAKPASEPEIYQDCQIFAEPIREGNQYRLAGRIVKTVDGAVLERSFIRADVFTSLEDAQSGAIRKAQQIIDQNGASLFADGEAKRSA